MEFARAIHSKRIPRYPMLGVVFLCCAFPVVRETLMVPFAYFEMDTCWLDGLVGDEASIRPSH